jgi:hypothetical protein
MTTSVLMEMVDGVLVSGSVRRKCPEKSRDCTDLSKSLPPVKERGVRIPPHRKIDVARRLNSAFGENSR